MGFPVLAIALTVPGSPFSLSSRASTLLLPSSVSTLFPRCPSPHFFKDKLFSLFSVWLTGGNTFKAAVTIYVHDAVEKEVTLKVKGQRGQR